MKVVTLKSISKIRIAMPKPMTPKGESTYKCEKINYTLTLLLILFISNTIYSQHDWQRTNSGGGGAIAMVGATANGTILVASDLSGIYRSFDKGKTFDVVGANQGLLETHISAFGFHPTNGNIYFAGTYSATYKTKNGGDSFTKVFPDENHDFDYSYIEDIVISSDPNIGYLTHHLAPDSEGEIYKTIDGGNSWIEIEGSDFPDDMHLVKLLTHPTNPDIVYALTGKTRWGCSEANLYKSTNGGVNWIEIGSSLGDILDMDLHPTNTQIVFVSTFKSNFINNELCSGDNDYIFDDEFAGDFFKSVDGGSTFTILSDKTGIISVGTNNPDIIRLVDVLFPYDWFDYSGTWETKDGGLNWERIGVIDNWFRGYTDNQYYTMAQSYNGLNKTVTKDIFNSNNYFGSFGQWAWASFDGGKTLDNISTKEVSESQWLSTGMENINGHALDINDGNPNVVYIGGWDIGFWYSKNHGASWTRTQPDFNKYPEYSWNLGDGIIEDNIARRGAGSNVTTIISDPIRENVVWASFSAEQLSDSIENTFAHTGLFKSTNYGEDWVLVKNGLPDYDKSIRMYGLAIDKTSSNSNRILYVSIDGDIYKSIDDGLNWNKVLKNGGLKFIEVDQVNGHIVYAGGANGLWRSLDAGVNWEEIGLEKMRKYNSFTRPDIVPTWIDWSDNDNPVYPWEGVFDIQADPNNEGFVYITVHGPQGGIYRSEDKGENWSKNLLPDTHLRGVAISPKDSKVIYATSSKSYHSGGFGNSKGIQYSIDSGNTWSDANDGMAFSYGGMIEVEYGDHPYVWVWSPGTGMQNAKVPYFITDKTEDIATKKSMVYPNPTKGRITIANNNFKKFKIYSIKGTKLYEGQIINGQIDLGGVKSGVLVLKLIGNSSQKIRVIKVVKE